MFSGYLAALAFVLLLTSGIFLFGYAARKTAPLHVAALEIIVGLLLITPLILFTEHIRLAALFTRPSRQNWLWLGMASITGFVGGSFFSLSNLKTAGERINSLLSPAITACAVLAGAFAFHETISFVKGSGIVITITAVTVFLLFHTRKKAQSAHPYTAIWSGAATVLCITLTIVCSVRGTRHSQLSIMHSIWLRLVVALPTALTVFLYKLKTIGPAKSNVKFYSAIAGGVVAQTILASYLWFYCTAKLGIATFQVFIATLPLWVYAVDVYLLKKSKPSLLFIVTAIVAALGIGLLMM